MSTKWFTEPLGAHRVLQLEMAGPWLFEGTEEYPELGLRQLIQIGEFKGLGRGLVIDGSLQLTEYSDELYTPALLFPAALTARSRQRWLVVGGGDGPTAREALRFRDTQEVLLVDLSAMVVQQTQRLIPQFWQGCESDPRLTILNRDAGQVLSQASGKFDVVVFDLPDSGDDACANHLYSRAQFARAASLLNPGGVFVVQLEELSRLVRGNHSQRVSVLREVFDYVHSYRVFIEDYGYWESFAVAFQAPLSLIAPEEVEGRLDRLYAGRWEMLWNRDWHQCAFGSVRWPGRTRKKQNAVAS